MLLLKSLAFPLKANAIDFWTHYHMAWTNWKTQPNFKNLKRKLELKTHGYIECKWELEWE
jgi:hypothetical protein